MSMEEAVSKLADAINRLADAYGADPRAETQEAAPAPTQRRGRAKTTTDTPVDAGEATSGADTGSDASGTSTSAGETKTVVDAGTGKPVEVIEGVDRGAAKKLAAKLTTLPNGNDTLTDLLKKHVEEGKEVKFGSVPDSAIPALQKDIEAAIASASALAD